MGDSSSFIKIGPAGSGVTIKEEKSDVLDKREAWDEKGFAFISQIFIWHSKNGINSIQFKYPRVQDISKMQPGPGWFVMSDRHGTGNGTKFDVVSMDCRYEGITSIHGHTTPDNILCSVTFVTNRAQYGPFGGQHSGTGKNFNFQLGQGNGFAGFFGAFNKTNVTALGFYLKPR